MVIHDPSELGRVDQLIRANEQVYRVTEAAERGKTMWRDDGLLCDLIEPFWSDVVSAQTPVSFDEPAELICRGVDMPPPYALDDEELATHLWQVIEELAKMRIFLKRTDHLTDRQLYTLLWSQTLHELVKAMPPDSNTARLELDILDVQHHAPPCDVATPAQPQSDRDRFLPRG